jgi:hypothetical protein
VLVQLLKDRLRLFLRGFCEHHVHLDQSRGLDNMDLDYSVLSVLVRTPIHFTEHLKRSTLGAADL